MSPLLKEMLKFQNPELKVLRSRRFDTAVVCRRRAYGKASGQGSMPLEGSFWLPRLLWDYSLHEFYHHPLVSLGGQTDGAPPISDSEPQQS